MSAQAEVGAGGGWTAPYCGVQHYPAGARFSTSAFWATVTDRDSFAESTIWTPGCGLHPIEEMHDTAEQARAHAVKQLHALSGGRVGAAS